MGDTNGNGDRLTIGEKTRITLRFAQIIALVIGVWVLATEVAGLRNEISGMRRTTDRLSGLVEDRIAHEIQEIRERLILVEQRK